MALFLGALSWSAVCDCGISCSYALTFRNKFNKDNQWIQINMTFVLDIHRMSVGKEQSIFTVPIMENKKKTVTVYLLKNTYT